MVVGILFSIQYGYCGYTIELFLIVSIIIYPVNNFQHAMK